MKIKLSQLRKMYEQSIKITARFKIIKALQKLLNWIKESNIPTLAQYFDFGAKPFKIHLELMPHDLPQQLTFGKWVEWVSNFASARFIFWYVLAFLSLIFVLLFGEGNSITSTDFSPKLVMLINHP